MLKKPDFKIFDLVRQRFLKSEMPFLAEARETIKDRKTYQGIRILHNIPLTVTTVFKIELLVLGGADVTTTCISILPPQEEAIRILEAANLKVQIEHEFNEEYDFHLDCCAELLSLTHPKAGAVELTQTGSEKYRNAHLFYPVVSIDDSKLKCLETFFGTGDGFIRALFTMVGKELYNKKFVVFGYGKVGRGIVYALKKFTKTITVIDVTPIINDPDIIFISNSNRLQIKEATKNAYCCVTATGVSNLISGYYNFFREDFGNSILINMGANDEYGDHFATGDVQFGKKPFNFSIPEPTRLKYLDPIFYAHNLGIDLILSKQINPGYNPFPNHIAIEILKKWGKIQNENISSAFE